MSQIDEDAIQRWRRDGWIILPDFFDRQLAASTLEEAFQIFPTPLQFRLFHDRYADLRSSQFAGMRSFPFPGRQLSLLCVHENLLSLVEILLGCESPLMYQAQLWAKYQGAIAYEQTHHRDYAKNTMLSPATASSPDFVEIFIYLSDTWQPDGPTALVSMDLTKSLPLEPARFSRQDMPFLYDNETTATARAGAVLAYRGDVFHRGTELTRIDGARVGLKLAYKRREATWVMYYDALRIGFEPEWSKFVNAATSRQLEAVGFPLTYDDRWHSPDTISAMELRYGDS